MNILSGDPPRGRALQAILVLVILALILAPFLFPGAKALNVAAKTCVMILLVASYDLLIGYTGIVSFAHVMFFGVGAYGVGLALYGLGAGWGALGVGLAAAAALSLALALAIGLFSLRVQSIFFAMVTLAVAYALTCWRRSSRGSPAARTGARSRFRTCWRRVSGWSRARCSGSRSMARS
jgi:branched-chain amino acid transport system permease protein